MADKLKMQTENLADKNFEMLSKMFPNAVTETITGYDDKGGQWLKEQLMLMCLGKRYLVRL